MKRLLLAALLAVSAHADSLPLNFLGDSASLNFQGADFVSEFQSCPFEIFCDAYVVDLIATGDETTIHLADVAYASYTVAGVAPGWPGVVYDVPADGDLIIPTWDGENIRLIVDEPNLLNGINPGNPGSGGGQPNVPPTPPPVSTTPEPGTIGMVAIGLGLGALKIFARGSESLPQQDDTRVLH